MSFRSLNLMRVRTALTCGFLCAVVWTSVVSAQTQQQQSGQSGQTGTSSGAPPMSGASGSQDQEPAPPVATPAQPVTGSLAPHVQAAGEIRSAIGVGFHADEYVDSNVLGIAGSSDWLATTDVGGHFDIQRARETSDLMLTVAGGALLYPGNTQYNSGYGAAGITDTIGFRRGSLVVTDLFTILPDSPLGFGAGGLDGIPGNSLSSYGLLNPSATPDQSIQSLQTNRLSNEALVQGEWNSSPRTSWTFTGGYGILHYTNSAYVQPSDFNAGVGYNRSISRNNVLGISESANIYRFSPSVYSMNDNVVNVTYGRNISRRLVFRAGAGPEIDTFTYQIGPAPGTRISYNVNVGLSYASSNRARLDFSGYRYVSGGSGILFGAVTTGAQISAIKSVARHLSLTASVGYNLNQSLVQTSTATSSYGSFFVTAGISRTLGRTASIFARYNFEHQTASGATCINAICLASFNRQEGFIGFSWDTRPFSID